MLLQRPRQTGGSLRQVSIVAVGWLVLDDNVNDLPQVDADYVLACCWVLQHCAISAHQHHWVISGVHSLQEAHASNTEGLPKHR